MSSRLLVTGNFGSGNVGDEAILSCMIRDLREAVDAEVIVVSGDPARTEREHGVEAISRFSVDAMVREVQSCDLVVVAGDLLLNHDGDTDLQPPLGPGPHVMSPSLNVLMLAAAFGRRAMLYAVCVGPIDNVEQRGFVAAVVRLCQARTVRDEASRRSLLELLGTADEAGVDVVADPALRAPEGAGSTASTGEAVRDAVRPPAGIAAELLGRPEPQPHLKPGIVQDAFVCRLTVADDMSVILDQYHEQLSDLRRMADRYERSLAVYEQSVAVQLVERAWKLADRLLPPDSRARRSYQGLKRLLLGRRPEQPSAGPADVVAAGPCSAEPARLLADFGRRIAEDRPPLAIAIFSAMRLNPDDGQRPTQLALEIARRGTPVVFCHRTWDDANSTPRDSSPGWILELAHGASVDWWADLAGLLPDATRVAIFEWPHPALLEAAGCLRRGGWRIAYDVIDDWSAFAECGEAPWYRELVESRFVAASDAVVVVNRFLAGRARQLGAENTILVPNGVRLDLATVRESRAHERGEVTVGYFGQLTNAWFDWDLMAAAARARPTWRFYLIGYGGDGDSVSLPSNVVLLGRVPQRELAAYAASWDAGVVPFVDGPLAEAADPIKIYEYLAMGLPVVVTGVHVPADADGLVVRTTGVDEFVTEIETAAATAGALREAREVYACHCTWQVRVDALLEGVLPLKGESEEACRGPVG